MSLPTEADAVVDEYRYVRRRRPWRLIGSIVVVILAATLIDSLATNPNMRWDIVGQYLFEASIVQGLRTTLILTVISMTMGTVGGVILAVMRRSPNYVLQATASAYTAFFRGTPLIVQIIFWGYLGAIYPQLSLTIPLTDFSVFSIETNTVMTTTTAAALGLGFNEAAYMSEVVRGGFLAVGQGQQEAAHALGFTSSLTMRRIVMPQALRVIIPATGNQLISLLKATAMVSVIAGEDLLTRAQQIYTQNFQVLPLLIVASIWYLAIVLLLSIGQRQLEQKFGRGATRHSPSPYFQGLVSGMRRFGSGTMR